MSSREKLNHTSVHSDRTQTMVWDRPTDGSVHRFIEKFSHSWQLQALPLLFLSTPAWCHILALSLLIPALNFPITVLSCQPFPLGTVGRHIFQEQAQSQMKYSLIVPVVHSYAPHILWWSLLPEQGSILSLYLPLYSYLSLFQYLGMLWISLISLQPNLVLL